MAREVLPMGDMPIRVLTAGTFLNQLMLGFLLPSRTATSLGRFAGDVSASVDARRSRLVVESSGHFMQRDRPDVVMAAIRHIVVEVRRQSARMGDRSS